MPAAHNQASCGRGNPAGTGLAYSQVKRNPMRGNRLRRSCGLWGFISCSAGIDKSIEKELLWSPLSYKAANHATYFIPSYYPVDLYRTSLSISGA
jgi:hypothetical protein